MKSFQIQLKRFIAALLSIASLPLHALADDAQDLRPIDEWSMTVSPYIWGAGLEGTAGAFPGLPAVDVDVDFKDILKNLDMAGMAIVELRYRRYAAYMDLVYTKIGADESTPAAHTAFSVASMRSSMFLPVCVCGRSTPR
jgi:hypothetical protein